MKVASHKGAHMSKTRLSLLVVAIVVTLLIAIEWAIVHARSQTVLVFLANHELEWYEVIGLFVPVVSVFTVVVTAQSRTWAWVAVAALAGLFGVFSPMVESEIYLHSVQFWLNSPWLFFFVPGGLGVILAQVVPCIVAIMFVAFKQERR